MQVLRDHRARQAAERAERLEERLPWADTGKVFVDTDGGWLHPETLWHGTIQLASDTYTSLLPQVDQEVARAAESVVPRARRPLPSDTAAHASLTQEGAES
ncbi:hypothetical protein [Streptomyces sp. CHB19.2]|uniref:hypothetical protein n=1 Tax=Streptomyces sp. CHB19.2 TaxID=2841671 RepID=UPI00209510FA|nr:hypothetical protein [Streptomyces sp. CHB19.2]